RAGQWQPVRGNELIGSSAVTRTIRGATLAVRAGPMTMATATRRHDEPGESARQFGHLDPLVTAADLSCDECRSSPDTVALSGVPSVTNMQAALLVMLQIGMAAAAPTVAVDLAGLDSAAFDRLRGTALEQEIVVRLVQEGFAVVRREQAPEFVLTFSMRGDLLVIACDGPAGHLESVVTRPFERGADVHLEIAQKAVDLVRMARRAATPAVPPPPSPIEAASSTRLEALAGAEALWRSDAIDPLLRIGAAAVRASGLRFSMEAAWSHSTAPSLR